MEHLDQKIVSLLHTVISENAENDQSLTELEAVNHAQTGTEFVAQAC
ncbi:hypothetical protein ACWHAM_16480 [Paenibacillus terrae]|uniref:Uncharacterized protein n=1 Tax=Paenibacillus terrae (strain HPL-003) TaxID=985665 RepID=G7W1K1_PAETH|nr:hypothetical protein [Paenibacillus terrae]AET58005.1 hypothetical protein HPL003_06210 [Paenibacillus terrae HPL-003]